METEFDKVIQGYLSSERPKGANRSEELYKLVSCYFIEAMMKHNLSMKDIPLPSNPNAVCRVIRFFIEGKCYFWISYLENDLVSHVYFESLEDGLIQSIFATYDIDVPNIYTLLSKKLLDKKWVLGLENTM